MATIFTVSPGEAGSFQEQYQRLVETWIREFVDKSGSKPQDKEKKSEIRLTDGDRVIYGQIGEQFRNEITPEIIGQLEQIKSIPVGGVVVGAKILEVDGEVVLQSDAEGKVVINRFLGQERSEIEATHEIKSDAQRQQPKQEQSAAVESQTEYDSGLNRVRSSLRELPDGSLKQLLATQLSEMRSQLQQQQQQGQALEQLVRQRLAQPKETTWWQQVKTAISQTWQSLQKTRQEHSAGAALKTLFHSQVSPDSKVYQAENYTIERNGHCYTLSDKSGATLMQFQSTPMGVRVNSRCVQMSESHYQDIKQLCVQQSKGDELFGAFAPVGARETEYFKRVNAIVSALVQYSAKSGRTVQVDGQFSYKWKATPDRSVRIDAKDGRGPLLVQHQGQLRCRMNNRDLAYFEQMLPILNSPQRVSSSRANIKQSVQVGWDRN
jgi:hypothetical protein